MQSKLGHNSQAHCTVWTLEGQQLATGSQVGLPPAGQQAGGAGPRGEPGG